jgi:hypothetical protein
MNAAGAPGSEISGLPSLDPQSARALFPVLIERLMRMELPEEQAATIFRRMAEILSKPLSELEPDPVAEDSWKQWLDFCASFRAATPVGSYQDLLEDPERR